MKIIRIKNIGLLIILVMGLFFSGCEGNTVLEWIVQNDSSSSIEVNAIISFDGTSTKAIIETNDSKVIAMTNQRGGSSYPEAPDQVFDSLEIENSNGDTFKRDYTIAENWESTIEQEKKIPSRYEHEYVLVIADEDF